MSGRGAAGTVAILCGDPIVARIIGNLLQTVGYETRPAEDVAPEEIPTVALLFIAPGSDPDTDLNGGLSLFEGAEVPTLDFAGSSWPCRIEEIKASIEEALSNKASELAPEIAAPEPEAEPG